MKHLAFALALLSACATKITPPPIVDVAPPARYANIPRYEPGGPIVAPKRVEVVQPGPPRRGLVGDATIETVIDETGRVVESWRVAGSTELARLLMDSVAKSTFTPATLNGRPIAVRVQTSMTVR